MTPADVEATVRRFLEDVEQPSMAVDARLDLAPFAALYLIMSCEAAFDIKIDGDTIEWPTVGALIADLQQRVAALGAAQEPQR